MNLKEFAKLHGTSIAKLSTASGIPASTLYAISQGATTFDNIGISRFVKLADALGVSVDELYNMPSYSPNSLPVENKNGEEQALIDIFRKLDSHGQGVVIATAKALLK